LRKRGTSRRATKSGFSWQKVQTSMSLSPKEQEEVDMIIIGTVEEVDELYEVFKITTILSTNYFQLSTKDDKRM